MLPQNWHDHTDQEKLENLAKVLEATAYFVKIESPAAVIREDSMGLHLEISLLSEADEIRFNDAAPKSKWEITPFCKIHLSEDDAIRGLWWKRRIPHLGIAFPGSYWEWDCDLADYVSIMHMGGKKPGKVGGVSAYRAAVELSIRILERLVHRRIEMLDSMDLTGDVFLVEDFIEFTKQEKAEDGKLENPHLAFLRRLVTWEATEIENEAKRLGKEGDDDWITSKAMDRIEELKPEGYEYHYSPYDSGAWQFVSLKLLQDLGYE